MSKRVGISAVPRARTTAPIRATASKPKASKIQFESLFATIRAIFDRVYRAQSNEFYTLLGFTLFLVAFGVLMVLSASSIDSLIANNNALSIGAKQFGYAIIGLIGMTILSAIPVRVWQHRSVVILLASLSVQFLVIFFGKEVNGNKNWISIFGFTFQPSEFLKLAVIIALSAMLAKNVDYFHISKTWTPPIAVSVVALGLVLAGRDLGTAIVMAIAFLGLMLLAGMPTKLALKVVGIASVAGILLMSQSSSRWGRILAWLNPSAPDPNGYNWQSEHGEWAIAAGRLFGVGLGESKMKWSWIPEVENDFIFAIIAEEFGLIGALVVIVMFVLLARALVRILNRTQDTYSRFIVAGVTVWLVFQALINIAVVLRLLPVLGVPLPLISAGGSSLISTLGAIGLVLSIERSNHLGFGAVRSASRNRKAR